MKYIEEFQDPDLARRLLDDIHATVTRPWALMEVCGGQTHTIIRHGIDQLLPEQVELIHGPGCPVCVTPLEVIDKALEIASRPDVIFCSFGDMLRVPGTGRDLFQVRSEGGDVRVVYSPLDALKVARQNPGREVVFFGIGFETTAPPNAMTVYQAKRLGIPNFSLLVSHVRVPPAIEAIMRSPSCRVQGFLAAGHVCSVMGTGEYPELAARHRVPIVVTGFEPLDILEGVRRAVRQLERGEHTVDNAYARAVRPEGNPAALAMLEDVFEVTDRAWRGIGVIPDSGWRLSARYREFDAEHRFAVTGITTRGKPSAVAARSSRASSSRTSARPSAPPARRAPRSEPPWSPARAPAPRTTSTGAWNSPRPGRRHPRRMGPHASTAPLEASPVA